LVNAGKLIQTGLAKRLAIKVAVIEPLSDEAQILDALYDLVDLMI
jgi:nitric oxide reductase NorQ protein